MNLGEFRTRVARFVGMRTDDTDEVALIDGWVNEGTVKLLSETKINVVTAELATVNGVGDYTLDEDILSIEALWYEPTSGSSRMLEPIQTEDLLTRRITAGQTTDAPKFYSLSGAHLVMLYPTPSADSESVHMLYTPRPGVISDGSHSPEDDSRGNIPPEFHDVIEAYAKWKAAESEEHRPSEYGRKFMEEWILGLKRVKAQLNRKNGRMPRARVGRRSEVSSSNGRYPRY